MPIRNGASLVSHAFALVLLLAAAVPARAAAPAPTDETTGAPATADAATPAPRKNSKATSSAPGTAPALPFRLGLFYAHGFAQSGNLTRFILPNGGMGPTLPSPAALGLDLGVGLGDHIRYHFAVGLEWEGQSGYAAKGFRFDPLALGFPIPVWRNDDLAIHIEPLVHLVRGEILFQSQPMTSDSSLFRIESGFAVAATAVWRHWFIGVEPLAVDFRVFEANSQWVHTGFSRLWWFQITAGHEF